MKFRSNLCSVVSRESLKKCSDSLVFLKGKRFKIGQNNMQNLAEHRMIRISDFAITNWVV